MDWFEPNQRSHGFEPQPGYWETLPRYRLTFPAGGVDEPVAQLRGAQHDDVQMEYWTNSYDGDVMLYIAGDGHFAAQLGDCGFLAGPTRSVLSELNRSEARGGRAALTDRARYLILGPVFLRTEAIAAPPCPERELHPNAFVANGLPATIRRVDTEHRAETTTLAVEALRTASGRPRRVWRLTARPDYLWLRDVDARDATFYDILREKRAVLGYELSADHGASVDSTASVEQAAMLGSIVALAKAGAIREEVPAQTLAVVVVLVPKDWASVPTRQDEGSCRVWTFRYRPGVGVEAKTSGLCTIRQTLACIESFLQPPPGDANAHHWPWA